MRVNYDSYIEAVKGFDFSTLSDQALASKTRQFKERLAKKEDGWEILPEAFAVVSETAWRLLGKRPYDVQLMSGMALFEGHIVEMKTGEGKTLTSLFPIYLHALLGHKVHVVTVNEYLAQRDRDENRKVLNFLGIGVGITLNQMDIAHKKGHYQKDVIYGVASEFGFDYLRNHTTTTVDELTMGSMDVILIDEVDSILIDEAKTPLILSGKADEETANFRQAAALVATMTGYEQDLQTKFNQLFEKVDDVETADYILSPNKQIAFTDKGLDKILQSFELEQLDPGIYHMVKQAVHAKAYLTKDIDYVVEGDAVKIVDASTGRIMEGRRFKDGLHQALEAKEGVTIHGENQTLASITLQNFVMKYRYFAGMTGTALTEREEFLDVYGKNVAEIPTHRPMIRKDLDDCIYDTKDHKFEAILKILQSLEGQPVLIGVSTVQQSLALFSFLKEKGYQQVALLNAKNHLEEAYIVAQAGRIGQITIATNMAGRGTDILLGGNPEYLAQDLLRYEGMNVSKLRLVTNPRLVIPKGYKEPMELYVLKNRYDYLVDVESKICQVERERVLERGGLFVLGTERNEAKRVDNQLRGRAGRQGDPGESLFVISLEDDWLDRFKEALPDVVGDEAGLVSSKRVSRLMGSLQAKVEYQSRKAREHLTEFDEVDNVIRDRVYQIRDSLLTSSDIVKTAQGLLEESITRVDQLDPAYGLKEPGKGESVQTILKRVLPRRMRLVEAYAVFQEASFEELLRSTLLETIDQQWAHFLEVLEKEKEVAQMNQLGINKPLNRYREQVYDQYQWFMDAVGLAFVDAFFKLPYQQSFLDYSVL